MRTRLEAIRDRYYRPNTKHPEGDLVHHGDCETHRSMEVYRYAPCTCGLLHDLKILGDMALRLYPQMYEDEARQDAMIPGHRYWQGPVTEEELKKCDEFIKQHFGEPVSPSPEEWDQICKRDWTLIEEVFGKSFRDRKEALEQDGED
jgi:hypothetical protein